MKYRVGVREVHTQYFFVEADSKEEAMSKTEDALMLVVEGVVTDGDLDYSYTLDMDEWSVEEAE